MINNFDEKSLEIDNFIHENFLIIIKLKVFRKKFIKYFKINYEFNKKIKKFWVFYT